MNSKKRIFRLVMSAAMLAGSVRADERVESQAELLSAGRYREAYERTLEHVDKAAAVRDLAYSLLRQSLTSPDSFQRWYGLRATRTLTDPTLVPALRKIAREGDRYERSLALDALAATAPEEARQEFVRALRSPYRPVRLRGLRTLSRQRVPELVPNFSAVVAGDNDPDLRALAVRALGLTGSSEAIPSCRRALDDSSEVVQEEAVKALSQLGDETLGDTLRDRLASETEFESRVPLIRLMGFASDARLLDPLGELLADGDPEVRAYAAAAVARLTHELEATEQGKP